MDAARVDALAAAATHERKPPAPPIEHAAPVHAPATAEHAAQPAAAEHGAEHAQHPKFKVTTFIWQLINFGALLFLLIYFGGRKLNQWLRGRHEQLKSEIGEATRLRDEAKRRFDAQERRLAELEKEIAALRASMRKDAEAEQTRMLEAAQERAKRMQDDMRTQIDEQVKVAEAALRAEVANASVKLAAEMVRKAVSFEDERRLAREFVAGFGQSGTTDEEVR
jgi:F-type H+-transporting ATPase subunit b